MWARRWTWLSRAHDQEGQGCGELEIGPAGSWLGQDLMALEGLTRGSGPWTA